LWWALPDMANPNMIMIWWLWASWGNCSASKESVKKKIEIITHMVQRWYTVLEKGF
jgi:hypothetical protein